MLRRRGRLELGTVGARRLPPEAWLQGSVAQQPPRAAHLAAGHAQLRQRVAQLVSAGAPDHSKCALTADYTSRWSSAAARSELAEPAASTATAAVSHVPDKHRQACSAPFGTTCAHDTTDGRQPCLFA